MSRYYRVTVDDGTLEEPEGRCKYAIEVRNAVGEWTPWCLGSTPTALNREAILAEQRRVDQYCTQTRIVRIEEISEHPALAVLREIVDDAMCFGDGHAELRANLIREAERLIGGDDA